MQRSGDKITADNLRRSEKVRRITENKNQRVRVLTITKLIIVICLLLLSNLLQFNGINNDHARADVISFDKDLVWTMDDLAFNSSGEIFWTGTAYEFTQNATIMPKDTLIIDAGMILKFRNNTSLILFGTLKAQGTSASKITFTSSSTSPHEGNWTGLYFDGTRRLDAQKDSIVEFCIIEYAEIGIFSDQSSVTISNNEVKSSSDYGIKLSKSASMVVYNQLTDNPLQNGTGGILIEGSTATIDNNIIMNTSGIGVIADGDSSRIINNKISNITKGIKINNSDGLELDGNDIRNVTVGVHVNNSVSVTLTQNHFTSDNTAVYVTNNSKVRIENNDFMYDIKSGIIFNSNDADITGNTFKFINTSIESTGFRNLTIAHNTFDNVTQGMVLNKISDSKIANNNMNYISKTSINLANGVNVNISENQILNHFNDGIKITDGNGISVYRNDIFFGYGVSINVTDSLNTVIIENKIHFSFNNGITLNSSKPTKFQSNLMRNSKINDLTILGELSVFSLNNTFSYSKLFLGSKVKFTVMNYLTVKVQDQSNFPIQDVLIEIYIDGTKTYEYYTDENGLVNNVLLQYREYDGPQQIKEEKVILIALYEDLEFDFSPFQADMSNSTYFLLTANFVPELRIQSPKANTTLSGIVEINGTAFDLDTPIKTIQIQIGNGPWETVTPKNSDWTVWYYVLDTTKYSDGLYQLNFSISDGFSSKFYSLPVIIYNGQDVEQKFSIKIKYPFESEAVWETLVISGTTSAGDRSIRSVWIQIDDSPWTNATPKEVKDLPSRGELNSRALFYDWSEWNFTLNTRTMTNGEHTIWAIASDGFEIARHRRIIFVSNLGANQTVELHVDFEKPKNEETVSGLTTITGIVWGCRDTILDFKLYIDGIGITNMVNVQGPNWWMWNYTWNTTQEANGLHEIQVWARNTTRTVVDQILVIVFNEKGNGSTLTELSIRILNPLEGAYLNGTVRVHGITWSEFDEITDVHIQIDESKWWKVTKLEDNWVRWEYQLDTYAFNNGLHLITARLSTSNRTVTTWVYAIFVNVGKIDLLDIKITSPGNGTTVNGTVIVRGVAWYGDNSIISVEVQIRQFVWEPAEPLRDDFSIWFFDWNTSMLEDGEYTLECRVYDGVITVQDSIIVVVQNEAPDGPNGNGPPNGPPDNGTGPEDDSGGIPLEELLMLIGLITMGIMIVIVLIFVIFVLRKKEEAEEAKDAEDAEETEEIEEE
jgi:hypothetical protein